MYETDNNNKIDGENTGLTSCSSFVPVLILLYLLTVHVERETDRWTDKTNPLAWGASTAVVECFQLLQAWACAVIVTVTQHMDYGKQALVKILCANLQCSEFWLKVSKIVEEKTKQKTKTD